MATQAQKNASAKYDKNNTRSVLLKLNKTTDADILARLEDAENKQGYIKALVRKDIRGNAEVPSIDTIRYLILPVAKKNKLQCVYLFGSYARGEANEGSDIDLMISGGNIETMESYLRIQSEFEEYLGRSVDIVFEENVTENRGSRAGKRFFDHIERDKVLIYEQL